MKEAGNIGCKAHILILTYSSIFIASFARGGAETDLMADPGADANFIPAKLVEGIKQNWQDVKEDNIKPCKIYRKDTGDPSFTCHNTFKLDVSLQI